MQHDSRAVANFFLKLADEAGQSLTPMQVLKLVYFAHGWTLGLTGHALISDEIEAWEYGPVVRAVYEAFKHYGNQPIKELATETHPLMRSLTKGKPIAAKFTPQEEAILKKVWETYGRLKGFQLSELTHREGTPWDQTCKQHGQNSVIPNTTVEQFFKEAARQNAERRKQQAAG